jgi:predicted ATPase
VIGPSSQALHPTLATIALDRESIPDWDEHPFCVPAIRTLETLTLHSSVCFFVGENGSGKSTLLEALAGNFGFGVQGGSRHMAHRARADDDGGELADYLRLSWRRKPTYGYFLRAESFFNIATLIDELRAQDVYGGTSLHDQSHGESFLTLFQHRFRPGGFYLLDEPEAALSPQAQLAFLLHLHRLARARNTQLVIASHSPVITAYPGAQIISFDGDQVDEIGYEETGAFRIMSGFMRDREKYLRHLFAEDGAWENRQRGLAKEDGHAGR